MTAETRPLFPNYTQLPQRVPQWVWYAARMLTVGLALGVILTLFVRPDTGLFVFWRLMVPVLPLLFFVAPGLWRNICPMAAVNQTPRLFGFTQGRTLPPQVKQYAYVVGIVLFFVVVPTRKALFNESGWRWVCCCWRSLPRPLWAGFSSRAKAAGAAASARCCRCSACMDRHRLSACPTITASRVWAAPKTVMILTRTSPTWPIITIMTRIIAGIACSLPRLFRG
jgi:hypothetical protein